MVSCSSLTSGVFEYLQLDMFTTGHRVPVAGAGEDVDIIHNDKRLLLQSNDGEVVLISIFISMGVIPRPHWEHEGQRPVLPAAHLCAHKHNQTQESLSVFYFFIYRGSHHI